MFAHCARGARPYSQRVIYAYTKRVWQFIDTIAPVFHEPTNEIFL